jgi:predicted RNA-binding Zn ribbon-like protein
MVSIMRILTAYFEEGAALALSLANDLSEHRKGALAEPSPPSSGSDSDAATAQRLTVLQQQLRDVLEAQTVAESSKKLNAMLHDAAAAPTLAEDSDGRWRLHLHSVHADAISRRTANCAAGLATLIDDDEWPSIKQCVADRCDDYFLDLSRNQSRRFCSRTCANRINARTHRTRS